MEEMSNQEELDNSSRLEGLGEPGKYDQVHNQNTNNNEDEVTFSSNYIQESFDKIHAAIGKIEGEKLSAINQELSYLRHVLDYQNSKIEKLTALMSDIFENKNQSAIISSLQAMQENENDTSDQVNAVQEQVNQVQQVQDQVQEQVEKQVQDHVQRQVQDQVERQVQHHIPNSDLSNQQIHIDSNMDPALHHVAVAAVAAQAQQQAQNDQDKPRKRLYTKRNDEGGDVDAQFGDTFRGAKRPKITIDFLHNPMTVKEIYDEFTKGFRGQPPLCEMDSKYGKHEWRGDSRSKESKRYQRRKKLCDAIARGVQKYDKPAEEIIRYIEEFRGDKSLTWVMNGNLPPDLLN